MYSSIESIKKFIEPISASTSALLKAEEIEDLNKKRVNLHYSVLRLGDFPTVSAFINIANYLYTKKPSTNVLLSDNYFESHESFAVDFAYSSPNIDLLLAPTFKYERLVKYNRAVEIENELSSQF